MIDTKKPMECDRGDIFECKEGLGVVINHNIVRVSLGDTGTNYLAASRVPYYVGAETGIPISTLLGEDFIVRNVKTNREKVINIAQYAMCTPSWPDIPDVIADELIKADLLKDD